MIIRSPALVEEHPTNDAGMVVELIKIFPQFPLELCSPSDGVIISARHVLPNQEAQTIGVRIPARRGNFYVLPHGVEAQRFGGLQIELEGIVARRRVKALWPIALVSNSKIIQVAPIEINALAPVLRRLPVHALEGAPQGRRDAGHRATTDEGAGCGAIPLGRFDHVRR